MTRRLPLGAGILAALLALATCAPDEGEGDAIESATGGVEGAGARAVVADTAPRPEAPQPRTPPTPERYPDLAADTLVAPADSGDTLAIAPTVAELVELRSALGMPVLGVVAADIPDTFDEPRGTRRHNAVDILAPRGTPVLSAADGRVLRLFTSKAGGLMVYAADPSDRFVLMYAHLDGYARDLTEGAALRRGQTIGYVGTTGNAPPNVPHLHFAIMRTRNVAKWWSGLPIDPRPLLQPSTPLPASGN